ncbi:hypothetical protein EVAR_31186_1 [Eumeta japonica]|uniref:Uncharacterized protein n=1 Tax=Eumeta variegata TaxID=151549 RepID=A0A4C1VY87_EUMVA|nr:hypothetical protein EVAR_31186_1 [Eumeta japonica]
MRRAQARQSYIFRYVVILLRVYWRKVTRARRTASADWWITPGTAGMRPRDLFTTSRDYLESVGVIFHEQIYVGRAPVCVNEKRVLPLQRAILRRVNFKRDLAHRRFYDAALCRRGSMGGRRGLCRHAAPDKTESEERNLIRAGGATKARPLVGAFETRGVCVLRGAALRPRNLFYQNAVKRTQYVVIVSLIGRSTVCGAYLDDMKIINVDNIRISSDL